MFKAMFSIAVTMLLCFVTAQGQTSSVSLSNLYVTLSQPSDTTAEVEATQYQADSSSVPDRIQLNIQFDVSNAAQLDSIVVKYGTSAGAGDILSMTLEAIPVKGHTCLLYHGSLFDINGTNAAIRRLIPSESLLSPCHLSILGYDQSQLSTNELSMSNIQ